MACVFRQKSHFIGGQQHPLFLMILPPVILWVCAFAEKSQNYGGNPSPSFFSELRVALREVTAYTVRKMR